MAVKLKLNEVNSSNNNNTFKIGNSKKLPLKSNSINLSFSGNETVSVKKIPLKKKIDKNKKDFKRKVFKIKLSELNSNLKELIEMKKNVEAIFNQPNIDGGLVGGASLKAEEFGAICRLAATRVMA